MTIRNTINASKRAPKITQLVLNRETVQELTANEVETVAGGQVFGPRQPMTPIISPSNPSLQVAGCSGLANQ